MSTDDLTARVRDHLAHADTLPHGLAIALVSELADEVDRLRGELARTEQQIHEDGGFIDRIVDLEGDVSAARAALGRMRVLITEHPELIDTSWLRTALEGES